MRKYLAIFVAVLVLAGSPLIARASASYVQSKDGGAANATTMTTAAFTTAPAVGDVEVLVVSYGSNNCTLNTPTGYTLLGDKNFIPTYFFGQSVYYHVIASGDTGAVTITPSSACYMGYVEYDITGASGTVDGYTLVSSTSTTSLTITTAVPTASTALEIAVFADRLSATWGTPSTGWVQAQDQNIQNPDQDALYYSSPTGAAQTATESCCSTGGYAIAQSVNVESGASAPTYNELPVQHAGGKHSSIALGATLTVPALGPWENYFGSPGTDGSDAMAHISAANLTKWGNYCIGAGSSTAQTGGDTGGATIFGCAHPYQYTAINMMQPTTSGVVNTFPWTGGYTGTNCPAPYKGTKFATETGTDAPNWSSSSSTTNWFMYEVPTGGTYGSNADRIAGFYSGSLYTVFTNLNSTSLQTSLNDAFDNCTDTTGDVLDNYEGFWNDNAYIGLASQNWVLWWGQDVYDQHINWGTVNLSPYVSFNCNSGPPSTTFFNGGTYCSTTSQIDTKTIAQGNTTYGPDQNTSGGTAEISTATQAWNNFVAAIHHANKSIYSWQFNDLVNGYAACHFLNQAPNVTGGIHESATSRAWGDGRLQLDDTIEGEIDVASNVYACGGKGTFYIHDYLDNTDAKYFLNGTLTTVTNGGLMGTPVEQEDLRAHVYLMWLLWNDDFPQMIGSFTHACSSTGSCGTTYKSWTDVWPWDFAVPSGRITPYPTNALSSTGYYCNTETDYNNMGTGQTCATGGSHDSHICVAGTPPNCLFIAAFNHFYVWSYTACGSSPDQTKWSSGSGCVEDIGPMAVLYNLTGVTQTLSSTNLNNWVGTIYAQMSDVLWVGCTPTTAAYGVTAGDTLYPGDNGGTASTSAPSTTNVCSGTTEGDVYNGGRMGFIPLTSVLGTTLPDGEAVVLTNTTQ